MVKYLRIRQFGTQRRPEQSVGYSHAVKIHTGLDTQAWKARSVAQVAKYSSMSSDTSPTDRLGPRQVRLMKLDSSGEMGEGWWSAHTHVFSLDEAPKFKALSYTWDNPYYEIISHGSKLVEFSDKPAAHVPERLASNSTFHLRTNLYKAITTIWKENMAGWLWVDSMCINDDPVEKAEQVRLMKSIYSSADEVIVWLGMSDGFVDKLGRNMKDTSERFATAFFEAVGHGEVELNTLHKESYRDPRFLRAVGIPDLPTRFLEFALLCGFCRWFDRVWCIQEVILAQKVCVLLGNIQIPWIQMRDLTTLLTNYGWYDTINEKVNFAFAPDTHRDWMAGLKRLRRVSQLIPSSARAQDSDAKRDESQAKTTQWQLCASLLAEASQAQCADERDKVYGLLGVLDLVCDGQVSKNIQVDYSKPPELIYLEITREILKQSQTLDVICWKSNTSVDGDRNLPSWAIDYSTDICSLTRFHEDGVYLNGAYNASCGLQNPPDNVDKHLPFEVRDNSLHCYGVKFDSITYTSTWVFPKAGSSTTESYDPYRPLMDFMAIKLLELTVNHLPRPTALSESSNYGTHSTRTRYESLWRTIILDHEAEPYIPGRPASELYENWFVQYMIADTTLSIYKNKLNVQDTDAIVLRVGELLKELEADSQSSPRQLFFLQQFGGYEGVKSLIYLQLGFLRACRDRDEEANLIHEIYTHINLFTKAMANLEPNSVLFVTARGLLGLGPSCAEIGDEIWALRGGRVPFILRPISNQDDCQRRVVGGCFILDHMNGEMLGDRYGLQKEGCFVDII